MTEKLHRLIDSGADQAVINERVAGILESTMKDIARIGSDHEKRIRFLEKSVNYALGAIGLISALILVFEALKDHLR